MISGILKFFTRRKEKDNCNFCNKEHYKGLWIDYMGGFGFIKVVDSYCSDKCEKAMQIAISKCYECKKLSKQEIKATKDLRYVDV